MERFLNPLFETGIQRKPNVIENLPVMEYFIQVQDSPESRKLINQLKALQAKIVSKKRKKVRNCRHTDLTPYFNDQGKALEYHCVETTDADINAVNVPIGKYLLEN